MQQVIEKYKKHLSGLCNVDCNIFDTRLKEFNQPTDLFCLSCKNKCDYINTHLYGSYESVRWDNKYIYYCPAGFIFIAVALLNELDFLDYSVIAGPIFMSNTDEDIDTDVIVPRMTTSSVTHLTEIMAAVFCNYISKTKQLSSNEFLNDVYKVLDTLSISDKYPIELEKQLQNAIVDRDSAKAKEILNVLLGQIFFHSNGEFDVIKSRVLELVVLLSRSAIEGGANVEQIFTLNNNYMSEIETFNSLEKLSVWLTNILNRFVSYVFEFNDVKHTDTIFKVTSFIKENYVKKITLEDIANHVYLSKSYLSKIFKEEMNMSLTNYINNIRIEKSKPLLLDNSLTLVEVANLTGFDDQSYFTKNFKRIVNVSPGKFRAKHGKI